MKQRLFSIGKMAEMNDVTVPALRLYDKMGILKPRLVDEETGYYYYNIHQNARLDMIAYMKELGMSLQEIGSVLKTEDIALNEAVLARKNEQIHQQICSLRTRHSAMERAISAIERYRKSPGTGTISLEYIDRRNIWRIPCTENFYADSIAAYEQVLPSLRKALMTSGWPQIHSYNTGTSITQQRFKSERFVADRVFMFADQQAQEYGLSTEIVESGMYACIYPDNYDDEIVGAKKMVAFCRENEYQISGEYICEVLTKFYVFDSSKRIMLCVCKCRQVFPRNLLTLM